MIGEDRSPDMEGLLAAYARGPAALKEVLAALSSVLLDVPQPAGAWTIRQIVHHIADGDDLWKTCIQFALGDSGEDGSAAGRDVFGLQWYWSRAQDEWAELWAYSKREVEPSLALFEANRSRTVQLLQEVPEPLARRIVVRWPSGQEQEITVAWVVEMQTRHVADHIDDILRIHEAHAVQGA